MKAAWLTDIHMDFVEEAAKIALYNKIKSASCESVLITGDIANALSLTNVLQEMAAIIEKPIYFVLGNHDYYGSAVEPLRQKVMHLTQNEPLLHWLPVAPLQTISPHTLLLGQDCWADGRYGNYAKSKVILSDSSMILDLFESTIYGKDRLLQKMQELAAYDVKELKKNLHNAIENHHPKKILILMHVSPFRESAMHEGKICDDDFLPFFSSKVTGDMLIEVAEQHKEIEFLVLCGHTHSPAYYQPVENLYVKAGKAEYTKPEIQEIITL